jgi:hypothetical protein
VSQAERTGVRDLTYSRWHRADSIRRYLPPTTAAKLTAIDVDWCEACCFCFTPLALIETQVSTAPPKKAAITRALALMAGIGAFSVSIVRAPDGDDIAMFRFQSLTEDDAPIRDMQPPVYALFLWSLRDQHRCRGTENAAA